MSDQPETHAAVLAELRARAEEERECGWHGEADDLLDLANRIEAAVELERNAHTNDIHNALYMATGTPGNAAAMRAALEEVEGAIFEDEPGRFWLADAEVILHRVQAALAAPARNADRFKTKLDAQETWKREKHCIGDFDEWLFAPAYGGDHA